MIHAIAERESMVLHNLDHTTIKDSPKDKKPFQDLTVESSVLAVSSPKLSEPSSSSKWRPSREPKELPENESIVII